MKQEIKAQWMADLRSGEYKKGKQYLKQIDSSGKVSHCCLGVLCEQAVKAGILPTRQEGDVFYFGNAHLVLPDEVVRWAELDTANPELFNVDLPQEGYHGTYSLTMANDGGAAHKDENGVRKELEFPEIADLIEQYL